MKITKILPGAGKATTFPGWLHEWYGNHYAQISVDTTLKLKSAIKDVCRVLEGRVLPEIEEYTRALPDPPQGVSDHNFVFGYIDSDSWHLGVIDTNPVLQKYIANFPKHWDIVSRALGLSRQRSRHACGFVIANKPIEDFIPTTIISGTRCTAYTPASVEAVGGVKMDFLVINSLNDLAGAIQLIASKSAVPVGGVKIDGKHVPACRLVPNPKTGAWMDIWDLPEDQSVFRDISLGKTETVFQFNTPGAVQWLRQFGYKKGPDRWAIDSIEAMAAFTALDRPGPLDKDVVSGEDESKSHNLLVEYARRARGATPSPEIFSFFNGLFPETYGVMVYQEQLQKAYQYLTGCTGPEAEEFRRNIAKKKMEKVLGVYSAFIERASEKLGSKEDAEKTWEFFKTWGQYGFNKSHSVCYAVIAYGCAYLKHHYPLEWWTAVLRNANKDEINDSFWRHCGDLIDLPDVSRSHDVFDIIGQRIQAPLSLLHGIGEKAHAQLIAGRPYTDIKDFCNRIQAHKEAGATYSTKIETKEKKDRKTKEITIISKEVQKKKLGNSALHRGVVYTLIVSGAMDSLFPGDATTLEMLNKYEEALALSSGTKQAPVKPEYLNVNQLVRHQMRKSILPAYSAPILPMLKDRKIEGIVASGKRDLFKHDEYYPFATVKDIERINSIVPFPDDSIKVAVAAYVDEIRFFNYGENKSKEAVDITLDIDGARMKFVKWGRRDTGKLPRHWDTIVSKLKGSIVVAILNKYKENKPFSLEDVIIIQEPLISKEETKE